MHSYIKDLLVFIVDDEVAIASTLAKILIHAGYPARFFIDPLDLLEAARSECPDVVLADLKMPGLNGLDLAMQVMLSCPETRILLLSGYHSANEEFETAKRLGFAFDHLLKPVSPARVLDKMNGYYVDKQHRLRKKRAGARAAG